MSGRRSARGVIQECASSARGDFAIESQRDIGAARADAGGRHRSRGVKSGNYIGRWIDDEGESVGKAVVRAAGMRAQSVDSGNACSGDQCLRDGSSKPENVVVGVENGRGGQGVAIPLDYGSGDEAGAKSGDGRECWVAGARIGGRDRSEARAGVLLKCVAVIIASGSQKNHRERKSARCPKPLHENSLYFCCDREAANS